MPSRKKGLVPAVVRATIDGTGRRYGTVDIVTLAVFHVPELSPKRPGPWTGEAEKIAWIDPATGMNCIIRRSAYGHLCGYVAVEPGHPFYGFGADALPRDPGLEVHGRVAYAQACEHRRPVSTSIWRSPPTPDGPSAWWLGFECNHSFDLVPAIPRAGDFRSSGWSNGTLSGLHGDPSCFNRGCACPPRSSARSDGDHATRDPAGRLPAYRDEAYVYRECVHLAAQVDAVAKGLPMPERMSTPALGIVLPLIGDDR